MLHEYIQFRILYEQTATPARVWFPTGIGGVIHEAAPHDSGLPEALTPAYNRVL
jgi:hypothetical protein